MAPKVKLTYFNLRGRGEAARLLLAYGGIEYEDCRINPAFVDNAEWMELKPTTPYGSLPLLEWNGVVLAQSLAIARFVAKEVGLAGRNPMECAQVDEIVDAVNDMLVAGSKAMFSNDEEQMKKYFTDSLPHSLGQLEKRLIGRGGQYFVGNSISWADVQLYSFCSGLQDQSCLHKVPKIKNLMDRVGNIPNIKDWVEKRPVTLM